MPMWHTLKTIKLMMELPEVPCCFSRKGEYFACYPAEGELKIWNTKTDSLHQTFASTNLKGKVSCLAWSREREERKKHHSSHLIVSCGVGAKVVLWSLNKEEETILSSEHGEDVTCMDWDLGQTRLYSGSKDKHVIVWNVATGESIRKWKVDKSAVQSICCYGDGSVLLTAGRTIKMWSLEDYALIKKMTGHATAVGRLCFVSEDSFLSSAVNDRVINYWQPHGSSTAVATLTCEEEVSTFHCSVQDTVARTAVVGQDGSLFLYQFSPLNLPTSPLTARFTVQYATSSAKPTTPLPVLAAILPTASFDTVTLAHSSYIKPSLESMDFTQSSEKTCLVRDVKISGMLLPASKGVAAAAANAEMVTVLGPGNMTLSTQHPMTKSDKQEDDLRPFSERLEPSIRKSKGAAPTADSLTQLLVQSISSGDGKLLEEVLRVSKERLVATTVKRLPVHIVLPFLRKLVEMLQSTPYRGLQLSLWIKMVLASHPAYLLNVPELSASLSSLHQLLESRVTTFSKLCHLQGKLDLILTQADTDAAGDSAAEQALTTPLVTVTVEEESDEVEDWSSGSEEEMEEQSDNISAENIAGEESMEP